MENLAGEISNFTALKPYLQLALPLGYISYLASRLGIEQQVDAIHVTFITLTFSLISVLTWNICNSLIPESYIFFKMFLAALTPIAIALAWRKWGYSFILKILRKIGVSNSTHFPNTWTEIIENTKVGISQITVYLKSGEALTSHYIYDYADAPIDLLRWDSDGNIALYVTAKKPKDEDKFVPVSDLTKLETHGVIKYRLTYIPKEEIEYIETVINTPIS